MSRADIAERMKSIGTYRVEFEPTIDRLQQMYDECSELDGAASDEKVFAREIKLLNMILVYERELGLTPYGQKKLLEKVQTTEKKKANPLDDALEKFR